MTLKEKEPLLHILTLCAFAFAQPLYEILGKNAEFFSVRQNGAIDIITLVLFISLCIPTIIIIIDRIAYTLSEKSHLLTHKIIITILVTLCALPVVKSFSGFNSTLIITLSSCFGLITSYFYFRKYNLRLFFTYLSPSILIFPLLFLLHSEVHFLIFKPEPAKTQAPEIKNTPPIVIIIFDELPLSTIITEKNIIDSALFPGFSKIAKNFTWYPNATTVAEFTVKAVPALLTGNLPIKSEKNTEPKQSFSDWIGIPIYENYPKNIFTALSNQYELRIFETASSLCPETLCPNNKARHAFSIKKISNLINDISFIYLHLISPEGLKINLPRIDMGWSDFAMSSNNLNSIEEDDAAEFQSFLNSLTYSERPTLYFHHSTLPHTPWIYLPSGRLYSSVKINNMDASRIWENNSSTELHYKRHLLQSMYADKLLLKSIETLQKNNIYDKALIIVTTDHGASFLPGAGFRTATDKNYADILNIPLFIKIPGQEKPSIDERHILSIDILPVIFDLLGETTPWPMDGLTVGNRNNQPLKNIYYINEEGIKKQIEYSSELKYKSAKRKLKLIGNTGINGIYGGAKFADIIGRQSQNIICKRNINDQATIKNKKDFHAIKLSDNIVPALVDISLSRSALKENEVLAISLNNKVAAVIDKHITNNNDEFQSLINDQFFQSGENMLDLHAIDLTNNCK